MMMEYEASMGHFFNEEAFLKELDHKNILKVHESQKNVEIVVPSFLRQLKVYTKDDLEILKVNISN